VPPIARVKELLFWGKAAEALRRTHPVPRFKMSGAIPLLNFTLHGTHRDNSKFGHLGLLESGVSKEGFASIFKD
jgi:hypothetical protein